MTTTLTINELRREFHGVVSENLALAREIEDLRSELRGAHDAIAQLRSAASDWESLWEYLVDVYEGDAHLQRILPNPRHDLAEAVRALVEYVSARPLAHFARLFGVKAATLRRAACEGRLAAEKHGGVWYASESAVRLYLERMRRRG